MNKRIVKIKELISGQVDMGTFGLVELELIEMEKDFKQEMRQWLISEGFEMLSERV